MVHIIGHFLASAFFSLFVCIFGSGAVFAVEASKPGGGANFSAACLACNNDCETQYPTPLGPQQTCKRLCVEAGTCPAPATVQKNDSKPVGKMAPGSKAN